MNRLPDNLPCKDNPELWYADPRSAALELARSICQTCHHRLPCLEEALTAERDLVGAGRYGMYGALDPDERAELARRRTSKRSPTP